MNRRAPHVGFIGAGNMATALVRGFVASKTVPSSRISIADPDAKQRAKLRRRVAVGVERTNAALVRRSDVVILAVKPQILPAVLEEIRPDATTAKLFVSIAAGVSTGTIVDALGGKARVIRVMPNTPALVGKGASVLVRGGLAKATDERLVLRLFEAVGMARAVRDESLLDSVTGLSGSGPAFAYRFVEALIAGGVREGLAPKLASELAIRTLEGAAAMLAETGVSPERLREMVSSPGGTTVAGLRNLDRAKFFEAVSKTVAVAAARSRVLGKSA